MEGVEVLRDEGDKHQFDASIVLGRKEGRYYRWGRNEARNLIMRKLDGYEVCVDPDVKSALGPDTRLKKGADVDDTISFGDMILLETSVENHERLMELDRRKIVRRTKGVMTSYRQKIREASPGDVGRDLSFEEHGLGESAEGKGYGKGYTEQDLKNELEAAPEVQTGRSWKSRKE